MFILQKKMSIASLVQIWGGGAFCRKGGGGIFPDYPKYKDVRPRNNS